MIGWKTAQNLFNCQFFCRWILIICGNLEKKQSLWKSKRESLRIIIVFHQSKYLILWFDVMNNRGFATQNRNPYWGQWTKKTLWINRCERKYILHLGHFGKSKKNIVKTFEICMCFPQFYSILLCVEK